MRCWQLRAGRTKLPPGSHFFEIAQAAKADAPQGAAALRVFLCAHRTAFSLVAFVLWRFLTRLEIRQPKLKSAG